MSKMQREVPKVFAPLQDPARYKGAKGGRGSGKSYYFADEIIQKLIADPNLNVACMREVQKSIAKSSKKLLEDRINFYGLHDHFEIQKTEIRCKLGKGEIIFQGLQDHTVDSIKSLEGFDICWVEEAQTISEYSLDLLTPTFRKDGSELWFSWNPKYGKDAVTKLFRQRKNSILVHANYLDNPFCTQIIIDEAEEMKAGDEEKYKNIFLGEPQGNLDGVIPLSLLNQSINRTRVATEGVKTWALDVARFGEDSSVLSVKNAGELYIKESFKKLSLQELASKVAYLYSMEQHKPETVFVDAVGNGEGAAEFLVSMGMPVTEVKGSSRADEEIYENKRAEMYFGLKKFLLNGRIVVDEEAEMELLSLEYFYNRRDRIQLPLKSDIKKTLGRSPDKADSLAMHFAYKIFKKPEEEIYFDEGAAW